MQDQSALRRLAACTGLRAGACLAAGLAADCAAGLPTVFRVGLLVGLLGLTTDLVAVLDAGLAVVLGVDLTADLAVVLVAAFNAVLPAGLAAALAAGLLDLVGAFKAGLAFAAGLAVVVLLVAFLATEFLIWPLTSAVASGLGAPNFRRTGVPPQISSRL